MELQGRSIRFRLLLIFLLFSGAAVAAVIFLPAGLVRLAVLSLIGLPLAIFLFDRPKWVFYIFLIVLFSNIDMFAPFRTFRYIVIFLIVSFAFAVVNGRRLVFHDPLFIALVGAFFISVFQSLMVARDIDTSRWGLEGFIKVLVYIALAVQFVRNRREFRRLFLVMAVGILASNFLPFILEPPSKYGTLSLIWDLGVFRYEGYILEPNVFACFQIFLIPVLFFLIALYKRPRFARPVLLVALFASIFLLFLSFSRGGFVSLVFLLFILLFIERRNRSVLVPGLIIIALGAIVAPPVYWERISSLMDIDTGISGDYAVIARLETMKVALLMGMKRPFLGVGLQNFMYHSTSFIPFATPVHNVPLMIFSEAGVPALAFFIWIILHNLRVSRALMRRRNDPEAAQLGRILVIQQLSVLVNSMFIPIPYDSILWFTLSLPTMAAYAYRVSPAGGSPLQGAVLHPRGGSSSE